MATSATPLARPHRAQAGPPLLIPLVAYGVLMVVSVILLAHSPQPSASAASVLAWDSAHHSALEVAGCLGFAASLPLAIWTATVYRRLRTSLAVVAPGAVIGLVGGLLAAASLVLCGLVNWTISQVHGVADPALVRALADLSFAAGSAGFVAPLGLLIAGIAVPSLIIGLLPRPLAGVGLAIAALSLVSTFALLTSALEFTLPIGRFVGLAWLTAACVLLPRTRHEARRGGASARGSSASTLIERTGV